MESLIAKLSSDLPSIDGELLLGKVREGTDGVRCVSTQDELTLAAEIAASLVTHHPNWAVLAGRLLLEQIYIDTASSFSSYVQANQELLSSDLVDFVRANADALDAAIDEQCDRWLSFFAVRTLQRSYFLQNERPQFLWMRVACAVLFPDLKAVLHTYSLMSRGVYTHATPTLCNAGLKTGAQLASCFLLGMHGSDVGDVFETLKECALISHSVGGIGLHCSNIPARSDVNAGVVSMLRVFNNASRYVSQGTNKRPSAISITLEPWHADVFDFIDLRKNHGKEEYRARDLFYALWVPDLFMQKVLNDEEWHLFSPQDAPGLQDCWGEEFVQLYNQHVANHKYCKVVAARGLWDKILEAQIETGNPSLLYKDSCNRKSNQQNLGVIKSSNLCTEIVEYSSSEEIAVCNLASIALPTFAFALKSGGDSTTDGKTSDTNTQTDIVIDAADDAADAVDTAGCSPVAFDFEELHNVAKTITRNLNQCIDRTTYPLPACQRSNTRNRPIAVGVQGLADTYFKMGLAFDSSEAASLNRKIFETIYHGCLEASMELARENGNAYPSYANSPVSNGILQQDYYHDDHDGSIAEKPPSAIWNWDSLRRDIAKHGVYNSLVTAVMPTASTAQILGNVESVEPIMSNVFSRRTLSGEFQLVNHYLVEELEKRGLWNNEMRQQLIAHRGSVQLIDEIPAELKRRFKTAYELSMKSVIQQSADRAPYIDQSQSLNLFLPQPTIKQLTSMHFYAWKRGLKTGVYYLRTQPAADPIPFTINPKVRAAADASRQASEESQKRQKTDPEHCDVCSS